MLTNKSTLSKAILSVIAGLSFSGTVLADQYHYKDMLIGDRAAGLGGAFTAIADDASGLYYNPAGVVYSAKPKISGSVNAFNYKTTQYKGISKANPNQEWTRTSSGMVANYFGVVQPMGDSSIGFSIAIPNYDLEDQSDSFSNLQASQRLINNGATYQSGGNNYTFKANANNAVKQQEIDYNNSDTTTLAGVSFATPITDDFSIGLTLYGYMRKQELTFKQTSLIQGTTDQGGAGTAMNIKDSFYQKLQTEEFGLQPRLGLMWSPIEKLSLGLMIQSTFLLSQSPQGRIDNNLCSAEGCFEYDKTTDSYKEITDYLGQEIGLKTTRDNDLPVEMNLGVTYFATDALLYTADLGYATKTDIYEETLNLSGGVEYFFNPTWAISGAAYTNSANTSSNVAVTGDDHVNLYGASFALARYTKASNITVGLNYAYGSGQANLFDSSTNVQDVTVNNLNLFISTSASF